MRSTLFIFLLVSLPRLIFAQWTDDPMGLLVAEGTEYGRAFRVADTAAGCWFGYQYYDRDLAAVQHINAWGELSFPLQGLTLTDTTLYPNPYLIRGMVEDRAGGVILLYFMEDVEGYEPQPGWYVQRINTSGERLWGPYGVCAVPVRPLDPNVYSPQLVPDGAGGAYFAYNGRYPPFGNDPDWYNTVQHVDAEGTPLFPIDSPRLRRFPFMCSIAAGDGRVYLMARDVGYPLEVGCFDGTTGEELWYRGDVECGVFGIPRYSLVDPDDQGLWITYIDNGDLMVTRLSAEGEDDIPTTEFRPNENSNALSRPIILEDHSLILPSYDSSYPDRGTLLRINANGGLPWGADGIPILAASDTLRSRILGDVANNSELGRIYVAQYVTSANTRRLYLQSVTNSGTILWGTLGTPVFYLDEGIGADNPNAISLSDGSLLVTMQASNPNGPGSNRHVRRLLPDGTIVPVDESPKSSIPISPFIRDLYPNPFNASLTITCSSSNEPLTISIINVLGQQVTSHILPASQTSTTWTWQPKQQTTGLYFVALHTPSGQHEVRKIVLLR